MTKSDLDWADDDAFNAWRIAMGMKQVKQINAAWEAYQAGKAAAIATLPEQKSEPIAQVRYEGGYVYLVVLKLNNLPDGSLLYANLANDALRDAAEEVIRVREEREVNEPPLGYSLCRVIDDLRAALKK